MIFNLQLRSCARAKIADSKPSEAEMTGFQPSNGFRYDPTDLRG